MSGDTDLFYSCPRLTHPHRSHHYLPLKILNDDDFLNCGLLPHPADQQLQSTRYHMDLGSALRKVAHHRRNEQNACHLGLGHHRY